MKSRITLITALILAALVAAGVMVAAAGSDDDPAAGQRFTAADSGGAVTLAPGESFTVVLVGNPTTGYSWQVDDLDTAVLAVDEPAYEVGSDLIGAGGTYTFTFTAVAAGETELQMSYLRSWEEAEPLETFTLHVTTS